MFVQGNAYAGTKDTRFSCARYGNVVGTRGSVIPVFLEQRKSGKITITDPRMTRFWITLDQSVKFVIRCLDEMHGGIRPGEKLHQALVSEDEARSTVEVEGMYIIQPSHPWWKRENWGNAKALPEGFRYASDTNATWLSNEQLQELIAPYVLTESPVPA